MLETIAVILLILWVLGLVSAYTMGGLIHILLVVAVVVIFVRVNQGRRLKIVSNATWLFTNSTLLSYPVISVNIFLLGEGKMNAVKMLAIALIVAGALGLAYGSFTYTKETHQAKIGPIELSVKNKETVNVPVWAGVAAMVAGAFLLFARK
ncbi:MAG: lmo0937 family membrane protein [Methylotenera sp.]|nr:lmo0937 family membrane protein [Methylotenera sp.]